MSFKSKLKGMRKPYGARQEGTYQTRDTSCNRHVSRPAPVVHEDVTPDTPFDPLMNHMGAPVQNPVNTTTPATPLPDPSAYDDDRDMQMSEADEKALEAVIGCGFLVVATVVMAVLAAVAIGIYYWLF